MGKFSRVAQSGASSHLGSFDLSLPDLHEAQPLDEKPFESALAPITSSDEHFKTVIIPENLDLEKLLKEHKPQGFRPHIDWLHYLVGLMAEIPSLDHRILKGDPLAFLNLNSQILKVKMHNYQKYLEYLCTAGVLESDNQYIVGGKSKGYRLTAHYRTPGKLQPVYDMSLFRNRYQIEELRDDGDIPTTLIKSFEGLDIDILGAMGHLIETRQNELVTANIRNQHRIIASHNAHMSMIQQIAENRFFLKRDSYSGRLHTNLTNLKSDYRHFLKHRQGSLVAIDLANAMALFTLSLLKAEFYEDAISERITVREINQQDKFDIKILNLNSNLYIYSIMCGTFETPAIEAELSTYHKAVTTGQFYEIMGAQLSEFKGQQLTREQVKRIMFSVLFANPEEWRGSILDQKSLFHDIFPTVGDILDEWRELGHSNLARIIQRIETYLFIECLVPKIGEALGDVPMFTVHDCIVTLDDYVDRVQDIMYEEILRKTGFIPYLKTEKWSAKKI